jgi:transcriptional regulator with XRE-family HTH domain
MRFRHVNHTANTSSLVTFETGVLPQEFHKQEYVDGRPQDKNMKIGTTIRGYRLQKGLSQGDVEKRTGLLRCYLSRVENGHTVPSLDTLAKIAHALDLPLAQFFAEDSLGREMNTRKLSDDELRFLTQIRRYSTSLNDSDRKLLLAMVKKFAATAVR